MKLFNRISARLHGLFRREAVIGDIDEEMRLHLQMVVEENVRRGMPPEEARRAALRSFGNFDKVRDRAWEVRSGGWIETLAQDVRYGARVLARNKGYTLVAVLTLALGIGANTAIFSVVNELLLRPLPYPGAERIAMLWETSPEEQSLNTISPANFLTWREQSTLFEGMAAFVDQRVNLTGGGEPEEVAVQGATPELFQVLGVEPFLGRAMTVADALPDAPDVALVSHGFWVRRFGGDRGAIGRQILLNGKPHTVIGVLPPGFRWHIRQMSNTTRPTEIWVALPLPTKEPQSRGRFLTAVARLEPGVSFEQADSELKTIAARTALDAPGFNKGFGARVIPLREQLVGKVRPALIRLRAVLVVGEVALALVLLAGAGLLMKSFLRLQGVDPGFERDNVLTLVIRLPAAKYPGDAPKVALYREVGERLRALPGVRDFGMVNFLPFYGGLGARTFYTIEGRPVPERFEDGPSADVRVTDAGYFRAMGIPLLRGRGFTDSEMAEARHVVLVSESVARVIVLLLTFVSLVACYLPARRATRVDPLVALRYDG